MSKHYVKNEGYLDAGGERRYIISADAAGHTHHLAPGMLTEVRNEDIGRIIQYHNAHLGVFYVSEDEAKETGLEIAEPYVPPPPPEPEPAPAEIPPLHVEPEAEEGDEGEDEEGDEEEEAPEEADAPKGAPKKKAKKKGKKK